MTTINEDNNPWNFIDKETYKKNNIKFTNLIKLAKLGNESSYELIIKEMNPYNKYLASKFQSKVLEIEDLMQIANIGLCQGIKSFNCNLSSMNNAKGFLKKCMEREIIDYSSSLQTQKRKIWKDTISSDDTVYTSKDGNEVKIIDILADNKQSIENIIESKELEKDIIKFVSKNLTERQKNVFLMHFNGYSYSEICFKLNLNKKQVDNSLQLAKKNLKKVISINKS